MKVLYFAVNENPKMIEVENELDKLQGLVGGYIEPIVLDRSNNILLVCNEEGKILGLPHNKFVTDSSMNPIDSIKGNFFVCQSDGEEFCSLNDSFLNDVLKLFK